MTDGYEKESCELEPWTRQSSVCQFTDDSGNCTKPGLDNAKSGDYPLARPLFIYPAKQSLTNETFREFTRFSLEKAETDLVKEVWHVPTSESQHDTNLDKIESAIGDVTCSPAVRVPWTRCGPRARRC